MNHELLHNLVSSNGRTTIASRPSFVQKQFGLPPSCCWYYTFFTKHPVELRCRKSSFYWPSSVLYTIHWANFDARYLDEIFRNCDEPELSIRMSKNYAKLSRNSGWCFSDFWAIVTTSRQSLQRRSSLVFWIMSCSFMFLYQVGC